MTEKTISVNYTINGFNKFLRGRLIEETESHIKIKGLIDGTIFTIAKATITERADKEEGGQ